MIISPEALLGKASEQFEQLASKVDQMAADGNRIDQAEREIFSQLLAMGRTLLEMFVASRGTGDAGPTVEREGETFRRLPSTHSRCYLSIFGELMIERTVYGSRETQKIESAPLDALLGLPADKFSYVLMDWLERLCLKESYRESTVSLADLLGVWPSVASAERLNQAMAEHAPIYRQEQGAAPAKDEAKILVVTADGKGVVMRRPDQPSAEKSSADDKASETKGKKGTKRMAYVGAVYSIDPFIRSADDVMDEMKRKRRAEDRPAPVGKRVWAEMTRLSDGEMCNGRVTLFGQMENELRQRDPNNAKTVVCLMDGERALWNVKETFVPRAIGVLDLFHVMEKLNDAAKVFYPTGSDSAKTFVDDRLRQLLEGKVGYVIGGLRQMATKLRLKGDKRKKLMQVITYFDNNRDHMKYEEYLAAGYPIGSGVAEGACRHLVKDRMEQTGMRWRRDSAQAMLHLRAIYLNGDWDEFIESRIKHEQQRLYQLAA